MGVLFTGTVAVSGTNDSGKSTFAFECGAQPEDMAFIDADIKGKHFVDQVLSSNHKLGFYRDMVRLTEGLKEIDTHNKYMGIIAEMESEVNARGKKFEAIIFDTWTPFEVTFHPYVSANSSKFRAFWSANGVIKGAEMWKAAFKYEAETIDRLQDIGKLVILTSHLKPDVQGNRKTGKMVPDVKQPVIEKSLMRVYLTPSAKSAAPVGLILKRISKSLVTETGIKTTSVLPRRMEPFTWDEIRKYWENPIGNQALLPDQLPNDWELSILDNTLTEFQKKIMEYQSTQLSDEDTETGFPEETVTKVKEMAAEGKPKPVIAKALSISVSDVVKILE